MFRKQTNTIFISVSSILSDTSNIEALLNNLVGISTQIKLKELYQSENQTYYKTDITITNYIVLDSELSNTSSRIWSIIDVLYIGQLDQILTELHGFDVSRTFSNQRYCAVVNIYDNILSNFTSNCSNEFTNITLKYENISQSIIYSKFSVIRRLSTCNAFYLHSPCKLIKITANYSITVNQSLVFANKTFPINKYTPLEIGLGICIDKTTVQYRFKYSWMSVTSNVEYYIAFVGTTMSVICYIIIIVTYTHFKDLRTMPGLTLVCLCITLLFTNLLYLIATQISEEFSACKIVGILLHWGLIATQACILVIAFDLLSKFGSLKTETVRNRTKRLLNYLLFVLALPTFIVGAAVILNEFSTYDIGYGLNEICFVYHLYPRIFFYILPVSLSLLLVRQLSY